MWRAVLFLCVALRLGAQGHLPDFFPLQTGNQWILETGRAPDEILNIEVLRETKIDGVRYYLLTGFAQGDIWVRRGPEGEVFARNPISGGDEKIAHPAFGVAAYSTSLSDCEQEAQPAAVPPEPAAYLSVIYAPGSCRDAGLTGELYAEGIGLMRRSMITIQGEATYTLSYAKVDGDVFTADPKEVLLHFDFSHGAAGWLAGFSDYSLVNGDMHFAAESRILPDELASGEQKGIFMQSMNRSDDMFMYIKKGLYLTDGLKPNQPYSVSFDITFASNAQTGCFGVGGAPGEGVYLKAGVTADEPVSLAADGQHLVLNADKGQQSQGGADAGIVDNIANGEPCDPSNSPYVTMRKSYEHSLPVSTDERGQLWLMIGTDSAYEGLTTLFFQSVTVRLREIE